MKREKSLKKKKKAKSRPSGQNERSLASNANPHEEIKNTGKSNNR